MPLDETGGGEKRPSRPQSRNVQGGALAPCSLAPRTGFYRSGRCETGPEDPASHTVCAIVTAEFLAFSKAAGNDLSTPQPKHRFPGLKPGDRWCLCASRWQQAFEAGVAPPVVLDATERAALEHCRLEVLEAHAAT